MYIMCMHLNEKKLFKSMKKDGNKKPYSSIISVWIFGVINLMKIKIKEHT